MGGKPWIVAILACMVVAMIGVVFLQKAPEGFILSGFLRIADDEQDRLEELLRKEAAAELAAQKDKPIDPATIAIVKSGKDGLENGVDVTLQAQGKNARSAIDYLNELMVRYARREGRIDEMVQTKLAIAESERKLAGAVKEQQVTTEKIEATEKEIAQLEKRERVEAERISLKQAEMDAEAERKVAAPQLVAPELPEVALEPERKSAPMEREMEVPEVEPPPAPVASVVKDRRVERPSPAIVPEVEEEAPVSEPQVSLSEEERIELADYLRTLKGDRMRLISGGRRTNHPKVLDLDRLIKDVEAKLAPGGNRSANSRKVNYESGSPKSGGSATLTAFRNQRMKLEKELASLIRRQKQAEQTQLAMKQELVTLVAKHNQLDAAFKPVVLAPTKIVTQIDAPFPYARLIGTLLGSLIAGAVGYFFAKLGERPRVLASISEAESILRMPVQTIENRVRRRVA